MSLLDPIMYDGKTYDGKEIRQLVDALYTQAGVIDEGDFLVAAQGSPNATVQVAAGQAIVNATASGELGKYLQANDASINSGSFTATSTNGRKDRLILRITSGVAALEIVQGTPSGSPAEPSITGDNFLELALITFPPSTSNVTSGMITDRRVRAATPASLIPHSNAVRRVMANNNAYTNQTSYADLSNATDKAAMDSTFTKVRADTKLLVRVSATAELTSGSAQALFVGLNIGGTDYDVAFRQFYTATYRGEIVGEREIPGIAAGSLAVKPRFKSESAAAVSLWAGDDFISYSVTETY